MCQRVQCSKCGRPTFAGCGAHVEQVLRDVPKAERCVCRAEASKRSEAATPAEGVPRWLRSFLTK